MGKLVELIQLGVELNLDFQRKDADFEYELNGVNAFLESKATRSSGYFFAGGLAWFLALKPNIEDGDEYLSIFPEAKDYAGSDSSRWSIRVKHSLSIVNLAEGENSSRHFTMDYNSKAVISWGWPKFISIKNLRAGGYIKDDKIGIRTHLEVVAELIRS